MSFAQRHMTNTANTASRNARFAWVRFGMSVLGKQRSSLVSGVLCGYAMPKQVRHIESDSPRPDFVGMSH